MRSLIIHGALALSGLIGAYNVWTSKHELEADLGDVTVMECRASALNYVKLEEKDHEVTVEMKKIDGRKVAWVTDKKTPEKGKKTTKSFAGNEALEDYFDKLAPLRALRSLGNVSKDALAGFELKKPTINLALTCGGKKHQFDFGATAYGSGDRYMRKKSGGAVYLVSADVLRDLQSAEFKLMQRDLHRFESKDVDTLKVEAGGKSVELKQLNRLDPKKAEWVNAKTPSKRNELYGNWLDRVGRLRAQNYLKKGQSPGQDLDVKESIDVNNILKLDYLSKTGRSLGTTEIAKVTAGETAEYYARSESTHVWVKVPSSVGQQIEDDIPALFGGAKAAKKGAKKPGGAKKPAAPTSSSPAK